MSKWKMEAWAVFDLDGSFLAGPSNDRRAVEKECEGRYGKSGPGNRWKAVRLAPTRSGAASVIREARGIAAVHRRGALVYDTQLRRLTSAVDRYEKSR